MPVQRQTLGDLAIITRQRPADLVRVVLTILAEAPDRIVAAELSQNNAVMR